MKDEIKEILDKLKDSVDNSIDTVVDQFTLEAYHIPNFFCLDPTTNDCKVLLDYITNLQEEIEKLRSAYIGEKLKNDKSIEYIRAAKDISKMNIPSEFYKYEKHLTDILQGSDEE